MKVILLEKIPNLGNKYEVKEVSRGYGRNFLLAQNKAVLATEKNLAKYQDFLAREEADRKVKEEQLVSLIEKASSTTIEMGAKANEQGHLFAGISASDIAEVLINRYGISIDPEVLMMDHPIKTTGVHKVGLRKEAKTKKADNYITVEVNPLSEA